MFEHIEPHIGYTKEKEKNEKVSGNDVTSVDANRLVDRN